MDELAIIHQPVIFNMWCSPPSSMAVRAGHSQRIQSAGHSPQKASATDGCYIYHTKNIGQMIVRQLVTTHTGEQEPLFSTKTLQTDLVWSCHQTHLPGKDRLTRDCRGVVEKRQTEEGLGGHYRMDWQQLLNPALHSWRPRALDITDCPCIHHDLTNLTKFPKQNSAEHTLR